MPDTIYLITNTINNKTYVGKTKFSPIERFQQHCGLSNSGSQTHLHRAIAKYGDETFIVETLEVVEDGNIAERKWIEHLSPEYNMTAGGEGGDTSASPNYKAAMENRRSYAGKANPNFGKEGYWKDKKGPMANCKWWNNGIEELLLKESPAGWLEGRMKAECPHCDKAVDPMNKKWHFEYCKHNPNRVQQPKSHLIGLKWWNNGIEEIKAFDQPTGFIRGRIKGDKFVNKKYKENA